MADTEQSEDDVLRRMLRTPPKPHAKPKESTEGKSERQQRGKSRSQA